MPHAEADGDSWPQHGEKMARKDRRRRMAGSLSLMALFSRQDLGWRRIRHALLSQRMLPASRFRHCMKCAVEGFASQCRHAAAFDRCDAPYFLASLYLFSYGISPERESRQSALDKMAMRERRFAELSLARVSSTLRTLTTTSHAMTPFRAPSRAPRHTRHFARLSPTLAAAFTPTSRHARRAADVILAA